MDLFMTPQLESRGTAPRLAAPLRKSRRLMVVWLIFLHEQNNYLLSPGAFIVMLTMN